MDVSDASSFFEQQQGAPQGALADVLVLGEDRQELQVHAARAQLGQPVVPEGVGAAAFSLMQDREQQVVVSVGDADPGVAHAASGPTALTMTRHPPPGTYVIGISTTLVIRTSPALAPARMAASVASSWALRRQSSRLVAS